MSKIVSIHSFRGGTGKSNTTANVSAKVAMEGMRVGIMDTDIQSPGIHVLFGMGERTMTRALNDYLWGKCAIEEAAHDVSERMGLEAGNAYLIPSSLKAGEIARVLREGYDVGLLNDGIREAIERLNLDYFFIDTHPGLNEETLLSIAISDILIIIMRPDAQDFQGTIVTVDIARKLDVPRLLLVINKVPSRFDLEDTRKRVESTFDCPVATVMPLSEDVAALASEDIFCLKYPDHLISQCIEEIAAQVMA
jgi:septum site-determining protein MinD